MSHTQRHQLAVAGMEGHVLLATEAKGTNQSTGPRAYMDGAEISNVEIADLVQGNGRVGRQHGTQEAVVIAVSRAAGSSFTAGILGATPARRCAAG